MENLDMIKPRYTTSPKQRLLAKQVNEARQLGQELLREDEAFSRLVKAQVRYLYSAHTISDLEELFDVSGKELRAYITSRGFCLRVRW